MKMYIAVLDEFPDYMTPTLVAHSVLGAHMKFSEKYVSPEYQSYEYPHYVDWLENSFKKCVVRVNQKEFDKISALPNVYLGHENRTLDARKSCAVVCPMPDSELPNVLRFAKLWKPKQDTLEQVMERAGMIPLQDLLGGKDPISLRFVHTGIRNVRDFLEYAQKQHSQFELQRLLYELGGKEKDDMYEWMLSHAAVWKSVVLNLRAALEGEVE